MLCGDSSRSLCCALGLWQTVARSRPPTRLRALSQPFEWSGTTEEVYWVLWGEDRGQREEEGLSQLPGFHCGCPGWSWPGTMYPSHQLNDMFRILGLWLVAHKGPKPRVVVDGWQLPWGSKLVLPACVGWGHAGYLYRWVCRSSSISDIPEEEELILPTPPPHH